VSLLTSGDKLIRYICDHIEVNAESYKSFLLKFKGKDSYIYGDTQLVYFEEIREHLRTKDAPTLSIELIKAKK
jgi:hypothetical protein